MYHKKEHPVSLLDSIVSNIVVSNNLLPLINVHILQYNFLSKLALCEADLPAVMAESRLPV